MEQYTNSVHKNSNSKEIIDIINSVLEKLGEQHREIFWLKHESGLKNKAIAGILNISTKTVKRKLDQFLWELERKLKLSDLQ